MLSVTHHELYVNVSLTPHHNFIVDPLDNVMLVHLPAAWHWLTLRIRLNNVTLTPKQ